MKHDENKDLRSVSKIAKVNLGDKTIQVSKNTNIGIHMWGKIDFLTHYCGWHFIWNNSAGVGGYSYNESTSAREAKKIKKEHKLTDKTKKSSKKK